MRTSNFLIIPAVALMLGFAACDPGHSGTSLIVNNSTYPISIYFATNRLDTTILIPALTSSSIYSFGGLGSGKDYDCCPCEYLTITAVPEDPFKNLIKSIEDPDNWELENPNKREFSSKPIECIFTIEESDIQ
ncbi:MAG: hypothetical protein ACHQFW_07965 [Chitinophagales bacterium]